MPSEHQPAERPSFVGSDEDVDAVIELCDGDARVAVRVLILGECRARGAIGAPRARSVPWLCPSAAEGGTLMAHRLARSDRGNDAIMLAGCWAHCRRKFYELHVSDTSKIATATIERMTELWRVEDTVRGHSPPARAAARQKTSAAIVADLFSLWQATLPRISGKSKLAEAIRYAVTRRVIFERFLTDGRVELDSNIVERAIRPQTIT